MLIFPSSPVWAGIQRLPMWSEETTNYDSGVRQGSTPWVRPLYRYQIGATNYNEITQSSLHAFWNSTKGGTTPFLFKDPYDYQAGNITQPSSTNMNSGDGFFFINENGWKTLPDSSNLYLSDPASGQLLPSSHFVASLDNGFCTMLVAVSSVVVGSFEYFRKVSFDSQMSEASRVWNNFSTNLVLQEQVPNV